MLCPPALRLGPTCGPSKSGARIRSAPRWPDGSLPAPRCILQRCAGVQPGDVRIGACIESHVNDLSAPCKAVPVRRGHLGKAAFTSTIGSLDILPDAFVQSLDDIVKSFVVPAFVNPLSPAGISAGVGSSAERMRRSNRFPITS